VCYNESEKTPGKSRMSDVTPKIKAVLLIVVLIGAFAAYLLFDSAKSIARRGDTPGGSFGASLALPDNDKDADGLSDTDESVWNTDFQNPDTDGDGFLDGEEIASGHDPTKPSPDDSLGISGNVTEELAALMLGGLAEGSLKPDNQKYADSVNLLVDQLFAQVEPPPQSSTKTFLVLENSKENWERYYRDALPLLTGAIEESGNDFIQLLRILERGDADLSDLNAFVQDRDAYQSFISFLQTELAVLDERIRRLESVGVPRDIAEYHHRFIVFLKDLRHQYVLLTRLALDPVAGALALNRAVYLFTEELPDFAYRLSEEFLKDRL